MTGGDTATAIGSSSPSICREKVTLRVLGTPATLQEHIRRRAEQDLGIKLDYIVADGAAGAGVGAAIGCIVTLPIGCAPGAAVGAAVGGGAGAVAGASR